MLKLYYAPGTCALASHLALEAAGAIYETVRLNFAVSEQTTPGYLKLNPKGRVPALATERGILTETPAILQYVAQRFPEAKLAPLDDPFELARMNAFNSYLCSTVHVNHAHRVRGMRWSDDAAAIESMKRKVPQTVGDSFEMIEKEFFAGPWVFGDHRTVGDFYLYTICGWLEGDGVDINRFPKVADHWQRMNVDPVVVKVLAMESAGS